MYTGCSFMICETDNFATAVVSVSGRSLYDYSVCFSVLGVGKYGASFGMLEHTVEPFRCRGPNSTKNKHQLWRGCPPDDPVNLLALLH